MICTDFLQRKGSQKASTDPLVCLCFLRTLRYQGPSTSLRKKALDSGSGFISAIILSAGLSSRMGAFKPLLPLGNGTIIKQAVSNFQQAGIKEIHIVLGNRASDIVPHIDDMDVSWVVNEDFRKEMLTSVQIGMRHLKPETKAFFVLPVDIPLVRSQTLLALMDASGAHSHSILYPTFNGTRGHPPLIPQRYVETLIEYGGSGGLKGFLNQFEQNALDVHVADAGILMDMDTHDQYEQIKQRFNNWALPSEAECLAMLAFRFGETDAMIQHAKTVAGLARRIATKLNTAGYSIDVELVTACGYLHDIGKGIKGHAQFGADMLVRFGYPLIAEIVATHMDLEFTELDDITEKEVLFLADKKISGTRIMPLDERLSAKLTQFADNPDGSAAVKTRLGNAMKIEQGIDSIIGGKNGNRIKFSE